MAFAQIDTGYKPEFSLGALYQGFNAGNADQMAQEELIKQFLANQREQQMQPTDVEQNKQNLLASMYKSDCIITSPNEVTSFCTLWHL